MNGKMTPRLTTRSKLRWGWVVVVLVLLLGGVWWWRSGRRGVGEERGLVGTGSEAGKVVSVRKAAGVVPVDLKSLFAVVATNAPNGRKDDGAQGLLYRLSNTKQSLGELVRNERALLLRNAWIDTGLAGRPEIPASLRAAGDPGSYIVQAQGVITAGLRDWLERSGARIVSYVPNNAFLVRASAAVAGNIGQSPAIQAVEPYEPYYKLDGRLLGLAVRGELSPHG